MPPLFPDRRLTRWGRAAHGGRQGVDAVWAARLVSDPTLSSVYVTVDAWIGERVYRLARGPISTTSTADGLTRHYQAGLVEEPPVTSGFQIHSQSASARSVTVKVSA